MSELKRFRPRGNRVLIEIEDSEKASGSKLIYAPASATQEQRHGTVFATGGDYYVNGLLVPSVVNVGDYVMFNVTGAGKISIEGKTYHVVRNEDVVGFYQDVAV